MSEQPLVSIVIPTYNARRYIGDTIDSCLAQTYPHCEIIVVDDGSTDGTATLLRERYGERIRYLYQENAGPAAARNRGIDAAQGDFIHFCDADDQLLPAKVERCLEVFREQPEVTVVYTRYHHVAEDGRTRLPIPDPELLSGDIFCDLLRSNGNAILTSATLIRRQAILDIGCFNEARDLFGVEDWDFFLQLAARYLFASINEVLLHYRRYSGGLTANPLWMALGRLRTIQLARHYPGRERCLDDRAYDQLEAGRHHLLATVYWRQRQRSAARQEFWAAVRLTTSGRAMRLLLILLSYCLPVRSAAVVGRFRQWINHRLGRPSRSGIGRDPSSGIQEL